MPPTFQTISPRDGSILVERSYADSEHIDRVLDAGVRAQRRWRRLPLAERLARLEAFTAAVVAQKDLLSRELTQQMGRPISQTGGEIDGFAFRARTMLSMAEASLGDIRFPKAGFTRFIRREPIGLCLVLAPWNYPYLTAVNAIIPALAAGNTVLLKHSEQTPLCAERLSACAAAAGLPDGVFQHVHADHDQVAGMVKDPRTAFVAFTGSVEGGRAVRTAAAGRFIRVGLELGGKDPAYVRADADFDHAVANLVEGAFYNSGQSCCGIERIYVHRSMADRFIEAYAAETLKLRLGDPNDPQTSLGPMVRTRNADSVRRQVQDAIRAGAEGLIDARRFAADTGDSAYLAPQVLVNVDHSMSVMRDESFGPVVGIMAVDDDEEAIAKMNDSAYGLTAAIWTADEDAAVEIGSRLETGTVFMNRCDYLDPELAWVGVKDSGLGCTLSRVGYENVTRPKSFHLRRLN